MLRASLHEQRFLGRLLCPLIASIILVSAAPSQGAVRGEYDVKSAFVLNFILLTEWPEEVEAQSRGEIVVCLAGFDRVDPSFQSLSGRLIRGKIIRLVQSTVEQGLPPCQVVFFKKGQKTEYLVRMLKAAGKKPILTIGEESKVTKLGGAVHFYKERDRLRFTINPRVVADQGLKMSSRLLQIADIIHD